ncbi:MAG: hypothetical protein AAF702_43750 [Chloroflexota bacterium]
MNLFKSLFGKKLNGEALAHSSEMADRAQIELLLEFKDGAPSHDTLTQQRWSRVLPQPYEEMLARFVQEGWLSLENNGSSSQSRSGNKDQDSYQELSYQITETSQPFVALYEARLAKERAEIMPKVRAALKDRDTGEALELRRQYESRYPLGEAKWTGPEPQMSHSALTRRLLYLDHWLLNGYGAESVEWLKLYAAEQHLWGAYWPVEVEQIPPSVCQELSNNFVPSSETPSQKNPPATEIPVAEMAYWKAYQLALYVDNQETWQRCKGGDHVRRIRIQSHPDGQTCSHCQATVGQEFLVVRVPELPHKACTSTRGCLCRYEPVLDTYEGDS